MVLGWSPVTGYFDENGLWNHILDIRSVEAADGTFKAPMPASTLATIYDCSGVGPHVREYRQMPWHANWCLHCVSSLQF